MGGRRRSKALVSSAPSRNAGLSSSLPPVPVPFDATTFWDSNLRAAGSLGRALRIFRLLPIQFVNLEEPSKWGAPKVQWIVNFHKSLFFKSIKFTNILQRRRENVGLLSMTTVQNSFFLFSRYLGESVLNKPF